MWDVDFTLLHAGEVVAEAWKAAFVEVTGLAWRVTPSFAGRTDLDVCAEVFASHEVTGCTPDRFFADYIERVRRDEHLIATRGALMPGVPEVLDRLGRDPAVVQTLVTGNVPEVARAKVAAFGLAGVFDLEVGGYGTDDRVRSTLVRRSLERAEAKYAEAFRPVVVGDTVHDVAGGLANGAFTVGVATGGTSAEALAGAGAHTVLTDLTDTSEAVSRLMTG